MIEQDIEQVAVMINAVRLGAGALRDELLDRRAGSLRLEETELLEATRARCAEAASMLVLGIAENVRSRGPAFMGSKRTAEGYVRMARSLAEHGSNHLAAAHAIVDQTPWAAIGPEVQCVLTEWHLDPAFMERLGDDGAWLPPAGK